MMLADNIEVIGQLKDLIHTQGKGRLVYVTLSGSHLYGFNSSDSDKDYRGCFLTKTENLLGLDSVKDQISLFDHDKGIDGELFEMKKELDLLLKSNCNVLEHLFSRPLMWVGSTWEEMKDLISPIITKTGIYNSYRGMAFFNYKKFILNSKSTAKKYLYVFRGLMAGIRTLETGIIEPNISILNKSFGYKEIDDLIKTKKDNTENFKIGRVPELDLIVDELFKKIDDVYANCDMPAKVQVADRVKIDQWLRRTRKEFLEP